MKSLIGVLSLAIVLVYSQADEPHVCDKTLGPEELHQVEGDWVLVWMVSDKVKANWEMFPNWTSSHIELHVQSDHHTLVAHERNTYGEGKCASYTFNLTLPQSHEGHNRLDFLGAMETKDGEVKPFNEKGTAEFLPSSENTMKMLFKTEKSGDFLLVYRREGQHVDHLKEEHEQHRAMAKCLNLHGDNFEEWHYDGADFCHKTSVLPTLDSEHLHQVDGHWVLVWMAHATLSHDDPWMNLTSSHMEMHVQADKHTVEMHERNIIGGKCVSYKANLVLPQNSEKIHRLNMEGGMETIDGVEKPFTDTVTVEFFHSSEDTMEMFYKSDKHGYYLLMYKREGQHLDHLEKDHGKHKAKAKYLGLSGKGFEEWHYDGVTDFCHKKSVLPTLDSEELHQIDGDWVLVWMAHPKLSHDDPWMNLTSSHMEMHVQDDNHTVVMHERNMIGGKCISYKANLVLPQKSEKIHRLNTEGAMEIIDGEEKPFPGTATAEFFYSSEDTMEMFYKSDQHGYFLLMYKREGQHLDHLEKDHGKYKAKAKYLGLSGKNFDEWHYDGVTDFCHKPSALPTLDSEHLHQVDGKWVLVWMAHASLSHDDPWVNLTSSHMELHVQPDNHTVEMHEHNMIGGKCIAYKGNLVLPQKSEKIHRLNLEGGKEITDGVEKPWTDTVTAEFFPSAADIMKMFYKSDKEGYFLLMYRREGHHQDVKDLEKDHQEHKAKAKYLGLSGKGFDEWHYDGAAAFCPKHSASDS